MPNLNSIQLRAKELEGTLEGTPKVLHGVRHSLFSALFMYSEVIAASLRLSEAK